MPNDPRTDQRGDHRPSGQITFVNTGLKSDADLQRDGWYDDTEKPDGGRGMPERQYPGCYRNC